LFKVAYVHQALGFPIKNHTSYYVPLREVLEYEVSLLDLGATLQIYRLKVSGSNIFILKLSINSTATNKKGSTVHEAPALRGVREGLVTMKRCTHALASCFSV
jgi:hypothetical protein